MTIAEWHRDFKIGYNKTDSLNYPNFEPEEIDIFLNNAIFKFISQRAYGNNSKRETVEETQKRVDDLRNITKNFQIVTFTNNTNNKENGVFVALPSDYRYSLQEDIIVEYNDCNNNRVEKIIPVIPTTHDRYNRIIEDPFNKPYKDEVLRLPYESNNFELIIDPSLTPISYNIRYLATPQRVRYGSVYSTPSTDIDSVLAEHTHPEIIAIAVRDALENIESSRIVTNQQILNTTE